MRSNISYAVTDTLIGISVGRVPIGDQAVARRRVAGSNAVEFFRGQRPVKYSGSIDLAAKQLCNEVAALLIAVARSGDQERCLRQILVTSLQDFRNARTSVDKGDLAQQTIVTIDDGLLIQRRAAGRGIQAGRHEIPDLRLKWRPALHAIDFVAPAYPEFQASVLVDTQAKALIAVIIPAAQQALAAADVRQRWADKPEQGKAALRRQLAGHVGHFKKRADLRELLLDLPEAVGRAIDLLLDKSRSSRIVITMDQAHQLRPGGVRTLGIDVELDDFPRLHRDLVRVTKELDLCHVQIPISPYIPVASNLDRRRS